jgi:exosortase
MSLRSRTLLQIGVLVASFAAVYAHTVVRLVEDWSVDPNFSHGFFIPPIAAYMLWQRRGELNEARREPSLWGLAALAAGMGIYVIGYVGAELFTMRFSMLVTFMGLALYLFGREIAWKVLIPVLYLLLMIPLPAILWNQIAFPMQLMASDLAAAAIQLISIPVLREGNILHLPETTLQVVDACSGLRSLTSLLALSGALAYIVPLSRFFKIVLFLLAFPIAVAVNIFRLTFTAAAAHWISPAMAEGFLHEASGLVVFAIALVLLFAAYLGLAKLER